MSSYTLSGDLPPDIANAVKAATPVDGIDLSEDGTHLVAKSSDISYLASVADGKVAEVFCTDKSGARVPSFILRDRGKPEMVCYCCHGEGDTTVCHKIPCSWA